MLPSMMWLLSVATPIVKRVPGPTSFLWILFHVTANALPMVTRLAQKRFIRPDTITIAILVDVFTSNHTAPVLIFPTSVTVSLMSIDASLLAFSL